MGRNFVKGALVLTVCALIGKVIGAVYRIPFSYIVGAEGVGLYQLVYPLFTLILTISSGGLPSSISKLLSEQWASGQHSLAKATFRYSMQLLITFSAIGSIIIAALAWPISKLQGNTQAFWCYLTICPAVLFVGVLSGYRGFFQAKENMLPTAISGLIEQVVKLAFGLGFAYLFRASILKATIGALAGVTISEIIACLYMWISYKRYNKKQLVVLLTDTPIELTKKQIFKRIVSVALPITLGGIILPLSMLIDSTLIVNILSKTTDAAQATMLYGLQSGIVGSLSNLPVVASVAVSTAILPKISKEYAHKNHEELAQSTKQAILFVLLVALPCAICFYVFSEQIILFLYKESFSNLQLTVCVKLLKISSLSIVFLSLTQVSASILQGMGKVKVPLISMAIGVVIKILSLVILVNVPAINIYGAEISDIICYFAVFCINIAVIHKSIIYNNVLNWLKVFGVSAAVGAVALLTKMYTFPRLNVYVGLLVAGGITLFVYLIFIILVILQQKKQNNGFAYQKAIKKRKNS